jgi:acyl-CoA hydrolase
MDGKTVAQSRVVMARSMQPVDANGYGNVHGGAIMRFVDEAAGAVAIRHARARCVTASLDHMSFDAPVHVGDLVTITAWMTYVGRSSMEVECQVHAENFITGQVTHTSTCYLIYVAIDEAGHTIPVPPLILETDEERERWQAAERRRDLRQKVHQRKG